MNRLIRTAVQNSLLATSLMYLVPMRLLILHLVDVARSSEHGIPCTNEIVIEGSDIQSNGHLMGKPPDNCSLTQRGPSLNELRCRVGKGIGHSIVCPLISQK